MKNSSIITKELKKVKNNELFDKIEKFSLQRYDKAINSVRAAAYGTLSENMNSIKTESVIHLVIVGNVKAGKSTLLNALLKYELSSSEVTPETAVVIEYMFADSNCIELSFYNEYEWNEIEKSINDINADLFWNEYRAVNAERIKNKYINRKHKSVSYSSISDMANGLKKWTSSKCPEHFFVKSIKVGINDYALNKNVIIVDTPGLNDPVEMRSIQTKNYLHNADVLLVCVTSRELTGREVKFVNEMTKIVKPFQLYIVATQIDTFNNPANDWGEQESEWRKHLPKDQNIIPVSSFLYLGLNQSNSFDETNKYYWNILSIFHKLKINTDETGIKDACKLSGVDKLRDIINYDIISNRKRIYISKIDRVCKLVCRNETIIIEI